MIKGLIMGDYDKRAAIFIDFCMEFYQLKRRSIILVFKLKSLNFYRKYVLHSNP